MRLISDSEDADGESSMVGMKISSELETDKSSYKRKLRKRGKEHIEDELDIRREDKKKKKIKRKSKSKSPEVVVAEETAVEEMEKKKRGGREGLRGKKVKEERGEKTEEKQCTGGEMEELDEALAEVVGLDIASMPSHSLGSTAMEWINEVENGRKRSRNIQGGISGMMKRNLEQARDAIAALMIRAQEKGDQWYLRMENKEQHTQILALRKEVAELREQMEDLRKQLAENPPPPRWKNIVDAELEDGNFPPLPQRPPLREVSRPFAVRTDLPSEQREREVARQTEALEAIGKDIGERKKVQEVSRERQKTETEMDTDRERIGAEKTRGKPRIISNVQIVPPRFQSRRVWKRIEVEGSEEEWETVRGRRGNKNAKRKEERSGNETMTKKKVNREATAAPPPAPKARMARVPKSAAVTITAKAEGFLYADATKSARKRISLADLGIEDTRVRRAINGGLLIEVPGEGAQAKAASLMVRLKEVLQDSATVANPVKQAELRVSGLDDSVTTEEVAYMLARMGECETAEIKIGQIRTMRNGLGSVWAKLPVGAAAKASVEGKMRIRWTVARVEVLEVRSLQCHRCWEFGHVMNVCRSVKDRTGGCCNCGMNGHRARTCTALARCVPCEEAGRTAEHRMGGPLCQAKAAQGH